LTVSHFVLILAAAGGLSCDKPPRTPLPALGSSDDGLVQWDASGIIINCPAALIPIACSTADLAQGTINVFNLIGTSNQVAQTFQQGYSGAAGAVELFFIWPTTLTGVHANVQVNLYTVNSSGLPDRQIGTATETVSQTGFVDFVFSPPITLTKGVTYAFVVSDNTVIATSFGLSTAKGSNPLSTGWTTYGNTPVIGGYTPWSTTGISAPLAFAVIPAPSEDVCSACDANAQCTLENCSGAGCVGITINGQSPGTTLCACDPPYGGTGFTCCAPGYSAQGNTCVQQPCGSGMSCSPCLPDQVFDPTTQTCASTCAPGEYNAGTSCVQGYVQIAAGSSRSCGIRKDGSLWCWGAIQDFNSPLQEATTPMELDPGPWTSISDGGYAMCATRSDGTLWCWGFNVTNSLGTAQPTDQWLNKVQLTVPTLQSGGFFTAVSVATDFTYQHFPYDLQFPAGTPSITCAAEKSSGDIWCWRYTSPNPIAVPSQGGSPFVTVSIIPNATTNQVCGLDAEGFLWCAFRAANPVRQSVDRFKSATSYFLEYGTRGAADQLLAVKLDGSLWVGESSETQDNATLTQVMAGSPGTTTAGASIGSNYDWAAVTSNGNLGSATHCAWQTTGAMWCAGPDNDWGRLGVSAAVMTVDSGASLADWNQVASDVVAHWTQVAVGRDHVCGLTTDGAPYCWGRNNDGQLGTGVDTHKNSPTPVVLPKDQVAGKGWSGVSVGSGHTCAIRKQDQTLWCWGENDFGQLGLGQTPVRAPLVTGFPPVRSGDGMTQFPVQVLQTAQPAANATLETPIQGIQSWESVSSSANSNCGVLSTGDILCWGDNGKLNNLYPSHGSRWSRKRRRELPKAGWRHERNGLIEFGAGARVR
jgi:hypothetical protein